MTSILLLMAFMSAQAPASIHGTVVREGATTPVARAVVMLIPQRGPAVNVTTDEAGRFAFDSLPPGDYRIGATRDGYISTIVRAGPTAPGPAGRPVAVAAGQDLKGLVLTLTPHGAISGRLRDEFGDPVINVEVQALKYSYRNQARELMTLGSARSNDLGEFRIHSIPPGRYMVAAVPRQNQPGPPQNSMRSIVRVFFPGTSDAAAAALIDVLPGTTSSGADFTLNPITGFNVHGLAINGLTGRPLRVTTPAILLKDDSGQTVGAVATGEDGQFAFAALPRGSYFLTATFNGSEETGDTRLAARLQVDVRDREIEGLALVLQPGLSIPGRLSFGDGAAPTGDAPSGNVRVELRTIPWQPQLSSNAPYGPSRPAADGTFTLPGLQPGPYRLSITGVPPTRYVKTAKFGSVEVLDSPLQFDPVAGNALEIVLGNDPGSLEATVLDGRQLPVPGITVVLVPEVPHREREDMYRAGATNASGKVRLAGLVPGEYRVFAFEAIEPGSWLDPDFIRFYADRGRRVHIAGGGNESVELTPLK